MGKIVVTLFFLFPLLLAAQPVQENAVSETPVVAAPSFSLRGVHVSYGEFHDKISVAWDDASVRTYQVFRSNFKDRDFSLVAQVDALFWNDTTALSGVKYWYKIIPLPPQDDANYENPSVSSALFIGDEEYVLVGDLPLPVISDERKTDYVPTPDKAATPAEQIQSGSEEESPGTDTPPDVVPPSAYNYSGFFLSVKPKSVVVKNYLKNKNEKLKIPSDAKQKALLDKRLSYLSKFYMNSIKLSLVIKMSQSYLDKGDLFMFTDFASYDLFPDEHLVKFYGHDNSYIVMFYAKKLFSFFSRAEDEELKDILLKNAEAYCIYGGLAEITDSEGFTRIVYQYDAVGISTRYLKNDREWKSRTVMISSMKKEFKQKLMNAEVGK